ncbi:hypothetical protein F0562_017889 [Nyssa sinensis]|uniref:Uncharacterized protein n=1 Tax=Nyssa sinensis TaxID=561372 RepID=A0A5J4Z8J4_9ASTE|nr:hypothetical protein F0562_017889 [Nyssa sinensis]
MQHHLGKPINWAFKLIILLHLSFMYATYGPEYIYPQGVYNPYVGQQYLQIYGVPGALGTAMYPYSQLGQNVPSGPGYTTMHGYAVPGHQIVQFGGPSVNAITTSPIPTIQAPYPTGMAAPVPAPPQFIVPAHSPQFMQGSGSDQSGIAAGLRAAVLLLEWQASNLALQINHFAFYR